MNDHFCHATGCGRSVPPKMFMCRRHWYMLPIQYRNAIWNTYREGQENDKRPSKEYINASRRAIYYIACVEAGSTPEVISLPVINARTRVRFAEDEK